MALESDSTPALQADYVARVRVLDNKLRAFKNAAGPHESAAVQASVVHDRIKAHVEFQLQRLRHFAAAEADQPGPPGAPPETPAERAERAKRKILVTSIKLVQLTTDDARAASMERRGAFGREGRIGTGVPGPRTSSRRGCGTEASPPAPREEGGLCRRPLMRAWKAESSKGRCVIAGGPTLVGRRLERLMRGCRWTNSCLRATRLGK
ncbi:hypothetical protein M885DRAFT_616832 [Pelagophyceae sp. CCMP2097]|nr:hypothetical protein M885DRAFT_616832 [Pelagophyceae sp. CCMP2097]